MLANNHARIRRNHPRILLGSAAAVCLAAFTAAPALAAPPIEQSHDRGTDTFTEELCGIDVETTVDFVDNFKGRIGKNGFPLFHGSGQQKVTWFNPETGLSVELRIAGAFRDISVTDNEDGTITVLTQQTGIPEQITLPDGTVAIKDVGRIVFENVWDYSGTPTDPSDDVFISGRVVSTSGPHPEAESDFTLFCDTVVEGLT
jgi:hypothetical protein